MSHRPLPVRTLAEVTMSQVVLPKGQSVTKCPNAPKVIKFCAKTVKNDVMSENFPLVTAQFRFVRMLKIGQRVTRHTGCRIDYGTTVHQEKRFAIYQPPPPGPM